MNDDELDSWLRETHPRPVLPVSFQREVWARIAQTESSSLISSWALRSQDFLGWLSRPIPALALVAAMVTLGAGFGTLAARDGSFEHRHAYLASINPLHPIDLPNPE